MMKPCERCGRSPRWLAQGTEAAPWPHSEAFDYCARCSRDLCPECMEKGCCKAVPAESGMDRDYPEVPEGPEGPDA